MARRRGGRGARRPHAAGAVPAVRPGGAGCGRLAAADRRRPGNGRRRRGRRIRAVSGRGGPAGGDPRALHGRGPGGGRRTTRPEPRRADRAPHRQRLPGGLRRFRAGLRLPGGRRSLLSRHAPPRRAARARAGGLGGRGRGFQRRLSVRQPGRLATAGRHALAHVGHGPGGTGAGAAGLPGPVPRPGRGRRGLQPARRAGRRSSGRRGGGAALTGTRSHGRRRAGRRAGPPAGRPPPPPPRSRRPPVSRSWPPACRPWCRTWAAPA